jgi:hypothetical protein
MWEPVKEKRRVRLTDDDLNSIYSYDSTDDIFSNATEIFEEWLLRWNEPRRDVNSSFGILGIRVKSYEERAAYWGVDPELRSQAELQDMYVRLIKSTSESRNAALVDRAMRKLPVDAREEVECLLEDREKASSNDRFRRQWTVVCVRPKAKYHYGGEGFFKSAKSQDWLIMLKGETVDRVIRKLPDRFEDAWRNPYPPPLTRPRGRRLQRRRGPDNRHDFSRQDHDFLDREILREFPPFRAPSPYRPARSPSRNFSPLPDFRHRALTRDAELDGYRPGTIVVSEVPTAGEAEKKMDVILGNLTGKFTI